MIVKMKQFALLGITCWANYMRQIIENKNKNKKMEKVILMSPLETKNNY